jgi:hypothetical protein
VVVPLKTILDVARHTDVGSGRIGLTAEDVDKAFADVEHADASGTVRASACLDVSRAFWKEVPSSTQFLAKGVKMGVGKT